MELKKFTTGTKEFSVGRDFENARSADSDQVLRHLSLCHSVMIDKNSGRYNASSPDEQALVEGAKKCGFTFTQRAKVGNLNKIGIRLSDDSEESYEFLKELEFDSTRKRMSVVLRQDNGDIVVYCKGADSFVKKLLVLEHQSSKNMGLINSQI